MRKLILGLVILAALFAGTVYSAYRFDKDMRRIIDYVEAASILSEDGDNLEAVILLEHAIKRWERLEDYTHIFIHRSEVDAVSDSFFDYLSAIRTTQADDKGMRDKLLYHLSDVAEQEKISLISIF